MQEQTSMTHGSGTATNAPNVEAVRLDAESAKQVRRSLRALRSHEQRLATNFYGHLFRMAPEVHQLFPENMHEQRLQLFKAILNIVDELDDPRAVELKLLNLGESHFASGVKEHHFQYVSHALVRAVRELEPTHWSSSLSSAWIGLCSWMVTCLRAGWRRARDRAAARSGESFPAGPHP
jgi:hemoglobin-like flavoprotein